MNRQKLSYIQFCVCVCVCVCATDFISNLESWRNSSSQFLIFWKPHNKLRHQLYNSSVQYSCCQQHAPAVQQQRAIQLLPTARTSCTTAACSTAAANSTHQLYNSSVQHSCCQQHAPAVQQQRAIQLLPTARTSCTTAACNTAAANSTHQLYNSSVQYSCCQQHAWLKLFIVLQATIKFKFKQTVPQFIVLQNTALCTQQYTSLTQPHHVQCACLHVRNICCSVLPLVRECVPHVLPEGGRRTSGGAREPGHWKCRLHVPKYCEPKRQ